MIGSDRIACLNPRCRRTANRAKMGADCGEIICGKCWRAVPITLRARLKRLQHLNKKLMRLTDRRITARTISVCRVRAIGMRIGMRENRHWDVIRAYFQRPKTPVGLEGFLKEVGL